MQNLLSTYFCGPQAVETSKQEKKKKTRRFSIFTYMFRVRAGHKKAGLKGFSWSLADGLTNM